MNSICFATTPTDENLVGKSHWWGAPDLPGGVAYPYVMVTDPETGEDYAEPLTFLCQIRMEDVAPFDKEGLLPRKGMMYFFAAIDYFLGEMSPIEIPNHGPADDTIRVIYVEDVPADVQPWEMLWEGTDESVYRPAEAMSFALGTETSPMHALLSVPYQEEVSGSYPGYISLLQVEESDRWGLRFYDCGTLYLLIRPEDLKALRFDRMQVEIFTY